MFKPEITHKKRRSHIAGAKDLKSDNFKSNSITVTTDDRIKEAYASVTEISSIPGPQTQHRIITIKAIVTLDFILAVLAKEKITDLYIAVYVIGKKSIAELLSLHESQDIQNLFFLVNTRIYAKTGINEILTATVSKNWRVKIAYTHTKIILMETVQGNHYVVEGSGNMSQNGQYEQYIFENNKPVYDFHKNWMEKL